MRQRRRNRVRNRNQSRGCYVSRPGMRRGRVTYLDKMTPGQQGTIVGFVNDSPLTRRLLELGLVPGNLITYLRNAPLQDPMEIQVGPNRLSLRHADAALVAIELDD